MEVLVSEYGWVPREWDGCRPEEPWEIDDGWGDVELEEREMYDERFQETTPDALALLKRRVSDITGVSAGFTFA